MQIIKHGHTVREHICYSCGCIFRSNAKDVFRLHDRDIINCPECGERVEEVLHGTEETDC